MPVQINKEDYAKPWQPGIYPKSTTVIYNNQLWILNDTITGLFSSSDFLAEVANGDWVGRFTIENDLLTKQNLPTGFITGLQLSINADPTKIDIAPGAYTITDFSDLTNITVQIFQIDSPIIGITPTYLNTNNITYIGIDETQTIIQKNTPFTNEERRTIAVLGAAIHSNLINVNVTNEIKAPIVAPTNQLHDLIRAIGSFNLEGNIYSANGTNLQLDKSAGTVFGLGINANNYLNPHQLDISSQTSLTFRYRLQTGTEYSNTTLIDPTQIDVAGVLTPLTNNNKWQIQRINLFQSGLTRIQPGQHEYDNLEEAEANIKVESFVTETNIAENAIFRSYLIVKKNATDLSNITQAKFIPVDKFGNVITGNTALTLANIISALGFTPEDVSNKTTDFTTINHTLYPSIEAVKDYVDANISGGNQIQITHSPSNAITLANDQWTSFEYRGLSSVTLVAAFGTGSTPDVTLNFGSSFSLIPPIDKKLKGIHVMIQDGGYDLELGICKSDVGLSGGSYTNLNRRFIQKFSIPAAPRKPHYFEITTDDANGVDGSQYFPMIKKSTGVSQTLRFIMIYIIE